MERITGIGGFFFRSEQPDILDNWYAEHLGIELCPTSYEVEPWHQEKGPTIFGAEQPDTNYGRPDQTWRINFRVRSLDAMVAQLRAAGVEVEVESTVYPNGRFAHLKDPEGNNIELWEPA